MKVGLISDIHGSLDNLRKVLCLLDTMSCQIVCLGDLVSEDSEDNDACIQLINERNIPTVMGQHDDTCVNVNSPPVEEVSRNFLATLPTFMKKERLYLVHDNPLENARSGLGMWNRGSYIRSSLEADAVFEDFAFSEEQVQFVAVGHSHSPKLFSNKQGDIGFLYNEKIVLRKDELYILNPGRIGGVDRYDCGVTCAVLDTNVFEVTFFRLFNDDKLVVAITA